MSFSRDGSRLAVTVMDSSRRRVAASMWPKPERCFQCRAVVSAAVLSPNGTRLAVGLHPNEDRKEPAVVRRFDPDVR